MSYFSEREYGELPRSEEEIGVEAWGGILTVIESRINDGSFAYRFAEMCEDGHGPYATDEHAFMAALRAEVRGLPMFIVRDEVPSTAQILDIIEFCWRFAALPRRRGRYHSHFEHYHLDFDLEAGRASFREDINRIFRRNGVAFELTDEGRVERLAPPVLREHLGQAMFTTGDTDLDALLETARTKFFDPDGDVRREALEKLWDAWERLKTIEQTDKKTGAAAMLDTAAGSSSPKFKDVLETEATALNRVGNGFRIRHHETDREAFADFEHVDYLFHRMFALIRLILRATGRGG